jgi:hypothetical protein
MLLLSPRLPKTWQLPSAASWFDSSTQLETTGTCEMNARDACDVERGDVTAGTTTSATTFGLTFAK